MIGRREAAGRLLGVAGVVALPPAHRLAMGAQYGLASWYGAAFHGRRMANGRRFDMWGPNAAHRTLPLGTRCRVTCLRTGLSAEITIEDRGPYVAPRILDLSRGTARRIGMEGEGVAPVALVVLA